MFGHFARQGTSNNPGFIVNNCFKKKIIYGTGCALFKVKRVECFQPVANEQEPVHE
ncbi:hypothetical protein AC519_3760 [Pseudomonas savastanoi]|nr:hypothetical protein AC519_3760 [Pseudomonas savastanoi]